MFGVYTCFHIVIARNNMHNVLLHSTCWLSHVICALFCCDLSWFDHYTDVIMSFMASQITSLTVVYSTVYSDTDQRKHQSSASPAFVWGIHQDRWIPRTKGQLRGKCFHLMTSSCISWFTSAFMSYFANIIGIVSMAPGNPWVGAVNLRNKS